LGRPMGLVHVVAVPTVVAVEGVPARPGHHVPEAVPPGLERCREAEPAGRWDRRARVAPHEALLLLEQIHADVLAQPHPLAGVVVDLGVDPAVEPARPTRAPDSSSATKHHSGRLAPATHIAATCSPRSSGSPGAPVKSAGSPAVP